MGKPTRASAASETPVTDARLELELPDSFHRIKRTLLLLSGGLVLLGCTVVPASSAAALLGGAVAEGAAPTNTVLRACLLVAATYYLWGFLHEMRAAHRINADLLDVAGLRGFEAQIRTFAARTEQQIKSFEVVYGAFDRRAEAAVGGLEDAAKILRANPLKSLSTAVPEFKKAKAMALTSPNQSMHDKLEHEWQDFAKSVLAGRGDEAAALAGRASEALGQTRDDFHRLLQQTNYLAAIASKAAGRMRLNRSIYRDRTVSFWLWDVAGALTTYVIALSFTLTPWGFALADLLTRLVGG